MSDSLQPRGPQHAGPPGPSPTPSPWGSEAGARGLTPNGSPNPGLWRASQPPLGAAVTALGGPLETIQSQTPAQGASLCWTFSPRILLAGSTPAQGCGPSVLKFPRGPEQALSFSVWGQMTGGPPNHSRGSAGNPGGKAAA